ncbi:MAG: hypothetical protein NT121_03460, partial [Chloroflexi bacterium]|nr:hypothetical protein [Chloroflexota bacterium]
DGTPIDKQINSWSKYEKINSLQDCGPEAPNPEPSVAACTTLRGVVTPEKVSCLYGPGFMYLYYYGMRQGATQDIIGRNDLGTWVLTRSRGDTKTCWVKADLMKISDNVMCLPTIHPDNFRLPRTTYYGPLTGVRASRSGNTVNVSWDKLTLRADLDSLQTPYVVEAWVCRDGKFFFDPAGSKTTSVSIVDEPGCSEPSHGRVMAAEKHGYTKWVQIPWPVLAAPPTSTPTPANVMVTNFTLADAALTDYSKSISPTVLQKNILWIQITNKGQSKFLPPDGGGKYTIQVILKEPGGKFKKYDFVPGHATDPGLELIKSLGAGESQNIFIDTLSFYTAGENIEMEVFFIPESSLKTEKSAYKKTITVQGHPDSAIECGASVASAFFQLKPEIAAKLIGPALGAGIIEAGGDKLKLAKFLATWLFSNTMQTTQNTKNVVELLSLQADALLAMKEKTPTCLIFSDFVNAGLSTLLRNKFEVNGVITESPVYPLVTNDLGQRAGFLTTGEIVKEIPGSQVLTIDEDRFVLYPQNTKVTIEVRGYANGTMNLYSTFSKGSGQGTSIKYSGVKVVQGMTGTLLPASLDSQYALEVDEDSNGTNEYSINPSEVFSIAENGVTQLAVENPGSIVSTPVSETTPSSKPSSSPPFCGSFGLALPPLALIMLKSFRRNRKP